VATGLDGLDGDAIADLEILDLRTQRHDLAAELVAQDHGVLDTGQRVRIAGARRDGTVVVLVQVAATDAVVEHAKLHFVTHGRRLGYLLQTQILASVIDGCAHSVSSTRR
jgi:hypothetical protein